MRRRVGCLAPQGGRRTVNVAAHPAKAQSEGEVSRMDHQGAVSPARTNIQGIAGVGPGVAQAVVVQPAAAAPAWRVPWTWQMRRQLGDGPSTEAGGHVVYEARLVAPTQPAWTRYRAALAGAPHPDRVASTIDGDRGAPAVLTREHLLLARVQVDVWPMGGRTQPGAGWRTFVEAGQHTWMTDWLRRHPTTGACYYVRTLEVHPLVHGQGLARAVLTRTFGALGLSSQDAVLVEAYPLKTIFEPTWRAVRGGRATLVATYERLGFRPVWRHPVPSKFAVPMALGPAGFTQRGACAPGAVLRTERARMIGAHPARGLVTHPASARA